MNDNLPPLPQSFTILSRLQSGTEEVVPLDMVLAYGQQCRQQALEEAALACRYMRGFTYTQCDLFESAVLALRDKP